ncbi:hypothetical protein E2C01_019713 [Portunus trituberculatus]|uniref:Uncharacterized protein n=1 Tax=Portunus trituberculatus TaxID=210409 RepID=A0A5B7DYD0_PORTR|nr:hypothetical protein [Portunus trituberculatus]
MPQTLNSSMNQLDTTFESQHRRCVGDSTFAPSLSGTLAHRGVPSRRAFTLPPGNPKLYEMQLCFVQHCESPHSPSAWSLLPLFDPLLQLHRVKPLAPKRRRSARRCILPSREELGITHPRVLQDGPHLCLIQRHGAFGVKSISHLTLESIP